MAPNTYPLACSCQLPGPCSLCASPFSIQPDSGLLQVLLQELSFQLLLGDMQEGKALLDRRFQEEEKNKVISSL